MNAPPGSQPPRPGPPPGGQPSPSGPPPGPQPYGPWAGAPGHPARRRRWLVGLVGAWAVVLLAVGVWSVRRDPPTVADQRDIAAAMPEVRRATGALMAAADGPGRVVVLGATVLTDCRITPVRAGREATRDATLYVPAGRALPVLEEIARALPAGYAPEAASSSGGRRIGLHADAGEFVGVDAVANADAQALTLRVSTGCRPAATADVGDPAAGPQPPVLTAALRALGDTGTPGGTGEPGGGTQRVVWSAPCGAGGVVATYTVRGVPAPEDLGASLERVTAGADVIRGESAGWAYRAAGGSVVVVPDGPDRVTVSATTACS